MSSVAWQAVSVGISAAADLGDLHVPAAGAALCPRTHLALPHPSICLPASDDFPRQFPCMVGRPLQDGGSGGVPSSEPLKVRFPAACGAGLAAYNVAAMLLLLLRRLLLFRHPLCLLYHWTSPAVCSPEHPAAAVCGSGGSGAEAPAGHHLPHQVLPGQYRQWAGGGGIRYCLVLLLPSKALGSCFAFLGGGCPCAAAAMRRPSRVSPHQPTAADHPAHAATALWTTGRTWNASGTTHSVMCSEWTPPRAASASCSQSRP